jgi:hypothetical protein
MVEMMKVHKEQFGWFKENINLRIVKWSFGESFKKLKLNCLGTLRCGFCSFLKVENWENHLGC